MNTAYEDFMYKETKMLQKTSNTKALNELTKNQPEL